MLSRHWQTKYEEVGKITVISDQIHVKSHVARDLLQVAAQFKTDKLVVWEYVVNGLQYADPGTNPVVTVRLDSRNKRIVITDNGRGMDWAGLQNFFVMHGENIDRKIGRPGRGRFGTGKSAAFGIADILRITTVCNRKRSKVELSRDRITKMGSEKPIPVYTIEQEVPTETSNGTTIEIEGIHLRSLDIRGVTRHIERKITGRPKNETVFVNNHECEFTEPPVAREKKFVPQGSPRDTLGDIEMTIKVAKAPLPEDLRGVSIYSKGVLYETTLVGSEGREMCQYIFGQVDIPRLDEDTSPIPAFDLSRSGQLNSNNELVRAIYAFVGEKIDEVRRELVRTERNRKKSEEAKKLAKQAEEIAQVINEDFDAFRKRVARTKAKASGGFDPLQLPASGDNNDRNLVFGTQIPAQIMSPTGGLGSSGGTHSGGTEPRSLEPLVIPDPTGAEKKGRPAGKADDKKVLHGGFQVGFKHMGEEAYRAQYVRDERTIYVNLDHPQIVAAESLGGIDDSTFRRLTYEVAFSEYAIALASELAAQDEYIDPSDPIVEIRETLNRVARKGARLYSQ
jgi:hypothetical protein